MVPGLAALVCAPPALSLPAAAVVPGERADRIAAVPGAARRAVPCLPALREPNCNALRGTRYSSYERRSPSTAHYRRTVILGIEILAKLGRFDHDAATTMAAILAAVVLMAYWILKT